MPTAGATIDRMQGQLLSRTLLMFCNFVYFHVSVRHDMTLGGLDFQSSTTHLVSGSFTPPYRAMYSCFYFNFAPGGEEALISTSKRHWSSTRQEILLISMKRAWPLTYFCVEHRH